MIANPIALLDAAYAVDALEDAWLDGIFRAAEPSLDRGRGMYAFSYDASNPSALDVSAIVERNVLRPVTNTGDGRAMLGAVDANFVENTYLSQTCSLASEVPEFDSSAARKVLAPHDIGDVLVINARDPSGRGWVFGSYLPKRGDLSTRERTMWGQIAAHLAAAYRLRLRLREAEAARLSVRGELEAADANAGEARDALRAAVIAYERAHAIAGNEPGEALRDWRVLVDARWSLIDGFETNGSRYIVARRNDSEARGPETLTPRERQVLNLAVLGQTNKLIAYELGISHATVRVLVARAAAKLGATSREALVRLYRLELERLRSS